MITKNGVCYDLNKSDYKSTQGEITFVFSSESHKDKFEQQLQINRDTLNYSLSKRFKLKVDVSALADIVLYRKIETRGFLIVAKEGKATCLNNLIFNQGKITNGN